MPSKPADDPRFTSVDWDDVSSRFPTVRARTVGLVVALLAVGGLFVYDYHVNPDDLIGEWTPTRIEWLNILAGVFVARYGVLPLVVDRDRTKEYLREFLTHPLGVVSFLYILVFAVLGVAGPKHFGYATATFSTKIQPPVYTSVYVGEIYPYECVGRMVGEYCHGTWRFPLGTTRVGEDMVKLLVYGMHLSFKLALGASVLMVLLATAVGTTAGYFGGKVDDVLMWYVDVQQTIPAIVVYIIVGTLYLEQGLFALALIFGLFDWGGIARLVRSETIKRRSAGYVRAARSAGASDFHVVRKHVVPNSAATIVTALTRQIPILILIQVALAYLQLSTVNLRSLGEVLTRAMSTNPVPWFQRWWVMASVVGFLAVTVVAFNLFGDAMSDVLDSQEEVA
jgi:peptide/nickel transport system permease protein